jgi:hypothetical protein
VWAGGFCSDRCQAASHCLGTPRYQKGLTKHVAIKLKFGCFPNQLGDIAGVARVAIEAGLGTLAVNASIARAKWCTPAALWMPSSPHNQSHKTIWTQGSRL